MTNLSDLKGSLDRALAADSKGQLVIDGTTLKPEGDSDAGAGIVKLFNEIWALTASS